ncbi:uncharacterized protein LOC135822497 [Sycon ciliatum]|uniref:uncharacterized protein LOC135822497 n=1 Tax=Sycon ciliatum TaxID=27933 RepID=UPI0031F6D3B6
MASPVQMRPSFALDEGLEGFSSDATAYPRVPKCLSTVRHETKVTEQYAKAVLDIKQCISRYEANASRPGAVILPQATEMAKSFIAIDKILFKKLRSPDSDDYIDVVSLLKAIGSLFNYLQTIKVEAQGCDELIAVVMQTIGLVGAFVPTSFRHLMPLQVASGLASLPLTSHRLCLDNLCLNTLPLCLIHAPAQRENFQAEEPGTCSAGVLRYVLQYCPSNSAHARVLETLMGLKEGVCMDLLKLIAYSSTPVRQNAARLLFHFFPQAQLSTSYYTKIKSLNWTHPSCQHRQCRSSGDAKTAVKMCMNAICASTSGGHYPPLYLCETCCARTHSDDNRDHFVVSLVQPSASIPLLCTADECVGQQVAVTTCYDDRCTQGGPPKRYCSMCEKTVHWLSAENHFPVQKTVPHLSHCSATQSGSILVEAVVSLLCEVSSESSALRSGNLHNTRSRFRRTVSSGTTGILQKTAQLDPTKDTRLLSQFGMVLLTSYCTVEASNDQDLIGRLAAAVIYWVYCVVDFGTGIIFNNLDPYKIKYATPWLTSFYDAHFDLLIKCLLPEPPACCRVGRLWSTITSPAERYKAGLQALHNLLLSGIFNHNAIFKIWNAVMPQWMKAIATHVDRKELHSFEPVVKRLFSLTLFLDGKTYDKFAFLKKGLRCGTTWEQIAYLQFYQVLLQVHIPVSKIEYCFYDVLSWHVPPSVSGNSIRATEGESTCAASTLADDGRHLLAAHPSCDTLSPLQDRHSSAARKAASSDEADCVSLNSLHVSSCTAPKQTLKQQNSLQCSPTLFVGGESDERPVKPTLEPTPSVKNNVSAQRSLPQKSDALFHCATAPSSPLGSLRIKKQFTARLSSMKSASEHNWARTSVKGLLNTALNIGVASAAGNLVTPFRTCEDATSLIQSESQETIPSVPFPMDIPDSCANLLRSVFMVDALVLLMSDSRLKDLADAKVDNVMVNQLLSLMLQFDWGNHDEIYRETSKSEPHTLLNCTHCKLQAWWFDLTKRLLLTFFPKARSLVWKESDGAEIMEAVCKGLRGNPRSEPASPTASLSDDESRTGKQKEEQSSSSSFTAALLVSRFVHIAKRSRDTSTSSLAPGSQSPKESLQPHGRSASFGNVLHNRRTSDGLVIPLNVAKEQPERSKRTYSVSYKANSEKERPRTSSQSASSRRKVSNQPSADSVTINSVKEATTPARKSSNGEDNAASSVASAVLGGKTPRTTKVGDEGKTARIHPCETPTNGKKAWDILRNLRGSPRLVSQLSESSDDTPVQPTTAMAAVAALAKKRAGQGSNAQADTVSASSRATTPTSSIQASRSNRQHIHTSSGDVSHPFAVVELMKPNRNLRKSVSMTHLAQQTLAAPKGGGFVRPSSSLILPGMIDSVPASSFSSSPLLLQLFLCVVQKLLEVKNGNAGPHHSILGCLRILLENASCLQLLKVLSEPLQFRLINSTLVPALWELMTVADTSNANAIYPVLSACLESQAGPLALAAELRRNLGHCNWQNRFTAVDQVVTLHYSSTASRNLPDDNRALVNVMALMFTLLMDKLQDPSHHVALQAMMFVENLPVGSLKMMVQAAEKHFYNMPQDRLLILRAIDLLLSFLPGSGAVSETVFCRMFQTLQSEVNPSEDIVTPILQLFTTGSFYEEMDYSGGGIADFDMLDSFRFSRCSTGSTSNLSAKRGSMGNDQMADLRGGSKTRFRLSAAYTYLATYSPVVIHPRSSKCFNAFVTQVFSDDDTEDSGVGDNISTRSSISRTSFGHNALKKSRIVMINSEDKRIAPIVVLHKLMAVFMKYLLSHKPAFAFSAKRPMERTDTTRLLVSLLKAQMGCKIRSSITVFTRPPDAIRAQPVFNVFLFNIAKVLDSNMDWGNHLLQFTLSVLRFSTAPNLEEGLSFSGPHYGLENLDVASQLAWLHAAVVILYKYQYRATDVHDLVKIILLTLNYRPHTKCQPARRPSVASSVFSSAPISSASSTNTGPSSMTIANIKLPNTCSNATSDGAGASLVLTAGDADLLSAIGEVEGEGGDCELDMVRNGASDGGFPPVVMSLRSQTSTSDEALATCERKPSLATSISSFSENVTSVPDTLAFGMSTLTPSQSHERPNSVNLDNVSCGRGTPAAACSLAPGSPQLAPNMDTDPLRPGAGFAEIPFPNGQRMSSSNAYSNSTLLGPSMAVGTIVSRLRNLSGHVEQSRGEQATGTQHPNQGNYREPDMAAFVDTPILNRLPPPNDNVFRCPNCSQIIPEFSDQILALAVVALEPLVQRYPKMAAPMLMEMLHSVSRLALMSTDSGSMGTLLPSSQAVARQFIRAVLFQFVNNQLFLQVFKSDLKHSTLLKAIVVSLPEPSQVPSTYKGLTLLSPISNLLMDISRQVNGLAMMTIISNLADYMQSLPNISPKHYTSLLPLFTSFFRRLPAIFDSVSMFKRKFIVPLRIMAMLLRNVDQQFRTLLPGFSNMLAYLLRQPHQMIPLGALLTVCFRAFLNFSHSKDKERLPRSVAAELVLAWRGKTLPHRSTFLNLIKFVAIDSGANIGGIIGFDGKELQPNNLPRNLRVRQHIVQSLDTAVNFLQSTYASTTLYQDLETSAKIKVATAQLVGLEVTGYQNRAQMERLLPWLHSPSGSFGQLTELQVIQRFRLFSWLFVAAMASDNSDDNSLCQPFLDDWTNVSVCLATLCTEFLRSFQEKLLVGKDRRVQILPMMFMTCMLWTIYLEQQCIADQAVNDFWSQVMGEVIQLLNFKSRAYESVITTPFLEMIEGFASAESSSLRKIWPIWLPLLRCSSTKFIQPQHLVTINKLRAPMPDSRISVPRRQVLLRWLQGVQVKLTGHEQAWEKNLFNQLRSRTTAAAAARR